jgi:hypothetical protein
LNGTCCGDNDDANNLLLFLPINRVFMCVLTEQSSGQLQKQQKYKVVTYKKREEQSQGIKRKE